MPDLKYAAAFRGDPPAAAQDCNLLDRRELALVAVERSRMPMVVTDPRQLDNPIVLANKAFLELTGYTSDEILGRNCRFMQGTGTEQSAIAELAEALARGDDNIEIELLNQRKNGSTFVNALGISAVRNEEGELLYYFASQKDVTTERKAQELEANEHRLLMEVDHRAMNALTLVQSIVNLSRAEDVTGLSRAINGRVASLGRAHRLLAERRWQSVSLKELIETEISSQVSRVSVQGECTQLLAHVVQPLGLVIHELMSNAQIHGALSRDNGHILLTWNILNTTLVLHWHEATPSLTQARLNDGFGLKIVRSVVERQLRGQAKFKLRKGGLAATIVIPDAIAFIS